MNDEEKMRSMVENALENDHIVLKELQNNMFELIATAYRTGVMTGIHLGSAALEEKW
jgi:hypothetical protein